MDILLALLIGGAFGAVLDRVGASNPNIIIGMLRLSDLRLMKAILLAIGAGAAGMFGGQMLGLVDPGHMSVKAAYPGVMLGGALLGFGWALSGYCPGTGLVAAAAGRWDAMAYLLGGLAGAFAYMLAYAPIKATGLLDTILGGKATLGAVPATDWPALWPQMDGALLGLIMAALFIATAFMLPERIGPQATRQPAE